MRKIKKGDQVIVIHGNDRGKQGAVLRVLKKGSGFRLMVEGINLIKKHVKPNPMAQQPGGIITKEAPIAYSNVVLVNPMTEKADRVGFKSLDDGRKARYFKSNGELVDI